MAQPEPDEGTSSRGQKRCRTTAQINSPEAPKRPRLINRDDSPSIFGRVKNMASGLWRWFVGEPSQTNGSYLEDEEISIVNESNNGYSMETIQASEPSILDALADKDEVELVKVVNSKTSKMFSNGCTPLERFYGKSYTIASKERREKEKSEKRSDYILSQMKQGALPRRETLRPFPQPSWRVNSSNGKSSKQNGVSFIENLKRKPLLARQAIFQSYQKDDLEKYRSIYDSVRVIPYPMMSNLSTSINRSSTPQRGLNNIIDSPFFPRKNPQTNSLFKSGPITKVQLSASFHKNLVETIEKSSKIPPLILLDHEDDQVEVLQSFPTKPKLTGQDADIIEIIEIYSPSRHEQKKSSPKKKVQRNTLESDLSVEKVCQNDYLTQLLEKYDVRRKTSEQQCREEEVRLEYSKELTEKIQSTVEDRLKKHLTITEVVIEDEEEEEEVLELPEITQEMEQIIIKSVRSRGEVLIDEFSIPITRRDIETLLGLNWLNDEVINFYMQMIQERSKLHDNWPTVFVTNTFFYPKLMQSGHSALKRWTRKVDVFAHDLMLVPIHLGMHWCLAVVNLKKKGIYYYDSMGGNNNRCLDALEKYLQDEHLDKKKSSFDTSGFEKVNVKNIPQQMNGSDCGMFACKFAEYISRNAAITFTQDDMPYYRRRMIYEIVKKNLLHP